MTTEVLEFPALKDALGKLDAKRKSLADLLAEAGPDYDMSKVKSIAGDTYAKVAAIGEMNKEIDEAKTAVDHLRTLHKAAELSRETEGARENGADADADRRGRKSFGSLVMASAAVKDYKPGASSGPVARVEIGLKTLFETGNGWDPEDLRTGRVEQYPTRPAPRVIDAFPQTETSMSTVLYMEETTFTNNAAEVAEGGQYAEAQLKLTERSSEVRKIAVFLPVTDEQFEDEPRARSYVENRLPFMLKQRLDLQLLTGDGTGQNLRGTENVVGINTQALGVNPIADAIYKAMRAIRETGFAEPSHVFIRPSKWEGVRLSRTADGVYIWGHPSMPGVETIWGVPVVQTTAVTATKAVMGDYLNFSEVSVRRGVDVQISNSHASYFVEGKLALRADLRCTAIHYRPTAFSVVSGL